MAPIMESLPILQEKSMATVTEYSVPSSPDGAVTPYDGKTHVFNIDMPAYSDKVMLTFNNAVKQTTGFESGATKLKNMLRDSNELIVCPGVYDGISARVALQVGFSALYMTGAGTTASRLGMADLGIAQLADMKEHAEMIANLDPYGPPLIADMDTGYGGPLIIDKAVKSYIRAGVAGFHIEDQIQNKRCGHLQGKKVVPAEEFYMRIRAAKAAKEAMNSDIVLIARTDALQQLGYDECVKRLKVARDMGADVGLLEGYTSKEMAAKTVKEFAPWPILLNMVENGSTPIITTKEAQEMGFRIMIFSFAALAPAYLAIQETFLRLKRDGVVGTPKNLTPRALFDVCGLKDSIVVDTAAGGGAFADGV
ncbi:putative oxaloacetate protein [Botrytis fragariae]|uniref:Putative oxaloacetate protein n=1 Tax=Botrytis fragariae TaxID=1964551 RepID=A0A8H6ARL3_9HELO|nr:putative oxaloacetate protein [Botrytis fragariae]KAF5872248.1 putative oxaloacetate protein [Botrytis fragariae]